MKREGRTFTGTRGDVVRIPVHGTLRNDGTKAQYRLIHERLRRKK